MAFLLKRKTSKLEEYKNILDSRELEFLEYIDKRKFEKRLKQIAKLSKKKKIIIYGAESLFFKVILKVYDLSKLTIMAVSDMKYDNQAENSDDLTAGYKKCTPSEIEKLQPDYVFVATRHPLGIVDELETLYEGKNIKVKTLLKLSFVEVIKEIWTQI